MRDDEVIILLGMDSVSTSRSFVLLLSSLWKLEVNQDFIEGRQLGGGVWFGGNV